MSVLTEQTVRCAFCPRDDDGLQQVIFVGPAAEADAALARHRAERHPGHRSSRPTLAGGHVLNDGRMVELHLDEIDVGADGLRGTVDQAELAELADSIRTLGLLEPIIVTPRQGRYLIVCGARRLAAAAKAGLQVVPAVVREMTDRERLEAMVVENVQRRNLTPIEEARAFQRLLDAGLTQRQVAERVSRSPSYVSTRIGLLDPVRARRILNPGPPRAPWEKMSRGEKIVKLASAIAELRGSVYATDPPAQQEAARKLAELALAAFELVNGRLVGGGTEAEAA